MSESDANAVAHVTLTLDNYSDRAFVTKSRKLGLDSDSIFFDVAMRQKMLVTSEAMRALLAQEQEAKA